MRNLLLILLFPFWTYSQEVQTIEVCTANQAHLQNYWITDGGDQYYWNVQGGNILVNNGNSIVVNWLDVPYSQYLISVYVVSALGCPGDTSYLFVDLDECPFDGIYVPNTFTPNNDENNNTWRPILNDDLIVEEFNILIFNRWGEIIWENHDPSVGWDGTYGGKLMQDGVYTWKIGYRFYNGGFRDNIYGHVTLLR